MTVIVRERVIGKEVGKVVLSYTMDGGDGEGHLSCDEGASGLKCSNGTLQGWCCMGEGGHVVMSKGAFFIF
eukprot:6038880-Ditylum_brightwellii.AAC.1